MLSMLNEICDECHNYFCTNADKRKGTYVISEGTISLPFLQNGQYFKIVGSVFNDGVHQYPALDLVDESFTGSVWAMAVPPSVIALTAEISEWKSKYEDVVNSPYTSESVQGVYSYSKAKSAIESGATWQSAFGKKLNRWRKIR